MANPNPKRSKRTQFQPGKSGNPGGRPKVGVDLQAILRAYLATVDPASRRTKAEKLMGALVEAGIEGNVKATMTILDRMCGRVSGDPAVVIDPEEIATAAQNLAKQHLLERKLRDRDARPAAEPPGEPVPPPPAPAPAAKPIIPTYVDPSAFVQIGDIIIKP
jgi:hypothetical protein